MLMDRLARSSRTSRVAFSGAIIGIMVIAIYNWVVRPHAQSLQAAQRYEIVIGDKARKNVILKANEEVSRKEIERLKAELAGARAKLFTPAEASRFFSSIEAICYEAQCTAHSINFLGNVDKMLVSLGDRKVIVSNSAAISLAGSYGQIIGFLAKLTGRPQEVLIHSLKIFSSGSESDLLECELMITAYIIHDEETFTNE
jgi:Tfp pilus assembly protein PilO